MDRHPTPLYEEINAPKFTAHHIFDYFYRPCGVWNRHPHPPLLRQSLLRISFTDWLADGNLLTHAVSVFTCVGKNF